MTAPDLAAMITAEHAEVCELAGSLTTQQWDAPSLCGGWSVRDVMIHLADHIHRSGPQAIGALVRGGFSPTRSTQRTVDRGRHIPAAELIGWLEQPVRAPSVVQLCELVIHHQDVRRALGLSRAMSPERVVACLDYGLTRAGSAAVAGARRRAIGLGLVGVDASWRHGGGAEITGPAEALLLALNGRREAIDDLSGEGVEVLRGRV